jgi:peptidoglycan/LPS O-acetylase OafA/YrhL
VSKSRFHIPSLDGLRTFSFLIVFCSHGGLDAIVPGGFGVTVFFFLSGFLITTLMRVEFDRTSTVSLGRFYLRRALRIFPPFYLVLIVTSLLTTAGVLAGKLEAPALLAQFLHYTNWRIVCHGYAGFAVGTGVYWSLAVEEHFYLVFPLLYLFLRKQKFTSARQARIILTLCGLIFVWRCVLVYVLHSPVDRTYVASDTRFDSILFGCALAIHGNPVLDAHVGTDARWQRLLFPLGVAGLLLSFLIRDAGFRETARYSLQGVALIPIFVCAMRFPNWGAMRVLNYRPVAFVGTLSYSLYLMHQVVLYSLVPQLIGKIGLLLSSTLSLVVALTLAWLVYVVVERPFAKLRKRFAV